MYLIATYACYLTISLLLTVWVAKTLHKNGRVFLVDAFHGNNELADSVNHLLVVGFYLVNVGFVSLALREYALTLDLRGAIELLSAKLGWVLLTLGAMHFFNLYVLSRMRKRGVAAHYGGGDARIAYAGPMGFSQPLAQAAGPTPPPPARTAFDDGE